MLNNVINNTFDCDICGSTSCRPCLINGIDYEYKIKGNFSFFQCKKCGYLKLYPRPKEGELKNFYPADYHSYVRPNFKLFILLAGCRLKKRVKNYLKLMGKAGNVLDVGCGDGEILKALENQKCNCYGIELKPEVCAAGQKDGLKVIHNTLENTEEFPAEYFDLIIMNHLIEHLEDVNLAFKRAYSMLNKKGWICGETPNFNCLEKRVFKDRWSGFHIPRHLQLFDEVILTAFLKKFNFTEIRIHKSLNPAQWAISLQNCYLKFFPHLKLKNGKCVFFPFFLVLSIPIVIAENLFCQRTGVIYFEAKK